MLALERIFDKYPQYVSLSGLETSFTASPEEKESLTSFLSELAYLQVLIVK